MDLGKLARWIVAEARRPSPAADAMSRLIDQCEAAQPQGDWSRFRSLPYAELEPLVDWLQAPFREEPPPQPLKALWFGLFNPCTEHGEPTADLYVCGSELFTPDPDDNSWAVDPPWWPEGRYAGSLVLAGIFRLAYSEGGLGNDAEYPLSLGYGAFAIREALSRIDPSLILGRSDKLAVAVGFDDGDFILLGELTTEGLTPIS
jgi:hypothetical protein